MSLRRVTSIILIAALIVSLFGGMPALAAGTATTLKFFIGQTLYFVNGVAKYMDVAPVILESRTLLPIRFVAEPLGATVGWDGATRQVTITLGAKVINLWIDNPSARVTGVATPIDPDNPLVTPIIQQSRTMLPVRFVVENLGADIEWNASERSITVTEREGTIAGPVVPTLESGERVRPPVVLSFTATPASLVSGARATLSWRTLNATSVKLDGVSVPVTGSKTVSPTTTTSYTIQATGTGGTTSQTRTVVVTSSAGTILMPPKLLLPGGFYVTPADTGETSDPAPLPGDFISLVPPQKVLSPMLPVKVRIYLDSLYCQQESRWDHFTDSDEPYLMVTAFDSGRTPRAWPSGPSYVFGDVDSGENHRYPVTHRAVYEGEVWPGGVIGFNALLWEQDDCPPVSAPAEVARFIGDVMSYTTPPVIGDLLGSLVEGIGQALSAVFSMIACLFGGGGDDLIGNETVTLTYDALRAAAQAGPTSARMLTFDGGSEGKFILRYHLEFGTTVSTYHMVRFSAWDDIAVGNIAGGAEHEIVVAVDEDAPGDNGRFIISRADSSIVGYFDAFFTKYDRIAVGDVMDDGYAEIIVASDDAGGRIAIYDKSGRQLRNFSARFTKYDGLAVGNVTGDSKAEIIIACDDDRKVYVYNAGGTKIREFGLGWAFAGARYHDSDTRHDALVVGDVTGDSYAEIVMLDCANGTESLVHVYDSTGRELRTPFKVLFTNYDGVALGDVTGDAKKELLIATDGGDGLRGCTIKAYNVTTGALARTSFWPVFTKYDGFVAGDVFGVGRDQMIVVTDEDDRLYISK
jgi:hypothetical protein